MHSTQTSADHQQPVLDVLISTKQIQDRVSEIGKQITLDYRGKELVLIGVLKGASIFTADLVRSIDLPLTMDFIAVSSYGNSSTHSGEVRILKDLDISLKGQDVLLVEDIIDTGLTLSYLIDNFVRRDAASVKVAAFLDKPDRRIATVDVAYVGFSIPNEFVVGYGLDYAEQYRNLPYVAILKL